MTNGAIPGRNKIMYSGQRDKVTYSQSKITFPNDSIFESRKLTRSA